MSLTLGAGPFADPEKAEERFNFKIKSPPHALYFEDSPKRIRIVFNKKIIVDSENAKMLHETGHLPVYYFPEKDIRMEWLEGTEHHTHCPFKGEASYRTIRVKDRRAENAVWSYPHPPEGAPRINGYFAFYWEKADAWFEEDEQIFGHPRDPYHRVDVRESARKLTVQINNKIVAQTYHPMLLFETGLPVRYYIPREDVHNDLLISSVLSSICPYKGKARYWSVKNGSEVIPDLAWGYPEPLAEATKVAGYICFPQEAKNVDFIF